MSVSSGREYPSRYAVFRAVKCPQCGAGLGKTCRGAQGQRRSPHYGRVYRWEATLNTPELGARGKLRREQLM